MRAFFSKNWWSEHSKSTTLLILAFIGLAMLSAILLGAHGVRGTDQYWYLADVTTLINGREPHSNLYFPRAVIEGREHANFFIHNSPVLYLSALFGSALGPFNGWLLVNIISHLLTGTCIYLASRKVTNQEISATCCFLYLISPIAIWQSLNMMQEQFLGAVLAIIVLAFSYKNTKSLHLLLQAALIFCIAIHPVFTAIATAYVLGRTYNAIRYRNMTLLGSNLIFMLLCGFFYTLYPLVFPTTFQPTLLSAIRGSVPEISNMLWHYSNTLPSIDFALISSKVIAAAQIHIQQVPVYFYTLAALCYALYLLLFKRSQMRSLEYMLCFTLALYVALSVLMQTQPRYQQIFAPVTFLTITIALEQTRKYFSNTTKNIFFTGATSAAITIGIYLCYTANIESKREQISLLEIDAGIGSLPQLSKILLVDSEHETKLGYLLRPRKVLSVKTHLLAPEAYQHTIAKFRPNFIISTHPVVQFPTPHHKISTVRTSHLGNFYLYEVATFVTASDRLSHTFDNRLHTGRR